MAPTTESGNSSRGSIASAPFKASHYANDGKHHLLLAASGSVATIKIPNILDALSKQPSLSIILLLTASAQNFLAGQSHEQPTWQSLRQIANVQAIYLDEDEWIIPWVRGNAIMHIELRRWAHLMAIVPLGANTLAKIVSGMCDGLVTSVVRAWDATGIDGFGLQEGFEGGTLQRKRILVAPAMNTAMWRQAITKTQISVLEGDWGAKNGGEDNEGYFEVLTPMSKELACGDVGSGAMMDWRDIVGIIEERLKALGTIMATA